MKIYFYFLVSALSFVRCIAAVSEDRDALLKTTAAIRDGFGRGDVAAIAALHHPEVVKYFGGSNIVIGRAALVKGLAEVFKTARMEFIDNEVESTIFCGDTVIETS